MQPQKFETYSLVDLCNSFDSELGPQYYDYLIETILSGQMNNCAEGMAYSLIELKDIIFHMEVRVNKLEFEINLVILLKAFMGHDKYMLVYVEGW